MALYLLHVLVYYPGGTGGCTDGQMPAVYDHHTPVYDLSRGVVGGGGGGVPGASHPRGAAGLLTRRRGMERGWGRGWGVLTPKVELNSTPSS